MSTPVQSQKAVSAYFTSKQILPFGFAEQSSKLDTVDIELMNLIGRDGHLAPSGA